MEFVTVAVMLFLIMDPLGNIPLFFSALKPVAEERRMLVLIRELLIALIIMIAFLYFGLEILNFLGIRTESISIAGGIILFLIAMKMIFPNTRGEYDDHYEGEPLVVPLAIPLVAGPSVLAALLLLAAKPAADSTMLLLALLSAWIATAIILVSAQKLSKFLGERGLVAIERLMGMLLVAISVQMFLDGIASYLQKA